MILIGILLIAVGTILLLKNLGIITPEFWDVFWPLFLIIIGIYVILQRLKKK